MTAPRKQVIVTIAPDGSIAATTRNIKGTACLDYINILEDMLDAEATRSHYTAEYHQTTQTDPDEVSHDLQQR